MKPRWIIRSFCIALLIACIGVWVGSYLRYVSQYEATLDTYEEVVRKNAQGDTSRRAFAQRVYVCDGKVGWFRDYFLDTNPFSRPWKLPLSNSDTTFWKDWDRKGTHIIGFSFYHDASAWFITFPIWFPTTIVATLLWLVWRKTRPKPDPKTAFPVEAKQNP